MTIHALPSYELPQTPVANRVNWRPQANRAALLIHDMQTYFLQKYDMSQAPIPMLIERIAALRDVCHKLGIPVFYTAQPTEQPEKDRALLNDFWGPGLTATEFHTQQAVVPELTPAEQDIMLTKWRYSAFQRSDLREQLRNLGRDQLIITGVYAHIGCMTTALEAFMQDVQPFLAIDGVADFSLEEHQMAIRHVSQRCGVSLTCTEIQDSLQS
ncbi:isochorismatase family protein [Alcaligenes faecalis]|uniref:isochorismatase family protein n=1 Tax=Alcaligenes faecalis TaxID=511 RepID=UPI00129336ED|nr:isochorismatase family protein [Alcaligenes faecalis]MBX6964592.1 isochorismatase family protein [Providencia rettgeri]MBX7032678.1 isochorismatase family protein [Alcaligenes faecalis]QFY76451.1 isochorismatase family protein [Alcaligenes faecalis]